MRRAKSARWPSLIRSAKVAASRSSRNRASSPMRGHDIAGLAGLGYCPAKLFRSNFTRYSFMLLARRHTLGASGRGKAARRVDQHHDIVAGERGGTLLLYRAVLIAPTRDADDHVVIRR